MLKVEKLTRKSTLITQLESLTYLKLFLTIAAGVDRPEFNPYNVLVLDILYLIFRGVKPRELSQNQDRVSLLLQSPRPPRLASRANVQAPMNKLAELLDDEGRRKSQKSRSGMTRHSRFGTTLTVRAVCLHPHEYHPGHVCEQADGHRAIKSLCCTNRTL